MVAHGIGWIVFDDYYDDEIEVSPPTTVDSDGNRSYGTAVPMDARVQLTTFTVTDGEGKGVQIDAVVYTGHTNPLELASKVVYENESYEIARRRLYKHPLDGERYQSFLLARLKQ